MKKIVVPSRECYDEQKEEFFTVPETVLHLEHSLISISKWESKWHKPFIANSNSMSQEEIIDYIKCMSVSPKEIDENVYLVLTNENIQEIVAYIQDGMTATWFKDEKNQKKASREIITSELIYYWMIALQIPFECQKWHLNRLLTLIRVCNIKNEEQNPNAKGNKLRGRELLSRNAALNAQRKAKLHTRG